MSDGTHSLRPHGNNRDNRDGGGGDSEDRMAEPAGADPEHGNRSLESSDPDSTRVAGATLTGAAYGMLLVLGFVVGLYGAFYATLAVAGVPVAALADVVAIFVISLVAGRLMGTRLASVLPAIGWLLAVVALSAPRPEGDLVVAGSSAGSPAWGSYLLLFGGTIAATTAVTLSQLGVSSRTRPRNGRA